MEEHEPHDNTSCEKQILHIYEIVELRTKLLY